MNLRAGHFSGRAVVLIAEPAGVVGHGVVVLGVEHASVVHQVEVGVGHNEARGLHVGIRLIVGHHWHSITFNDRGGKKEEDMNG